MFFFFRSWRIMIRNRIILVRFWRLLVLFELVAISFVLCFLDSLPITTLNKIKKCCVPTMRVIIVSLNPQILLPPLPKLTQVESGQVVSRIVLETGVLSTSSQTIIFSHHALLGNSTSHSFFQSTWCCSNRKLVTWAGRACSISRMHACGNKCNR